MFSKLCDFNFATVGYILLAIVVLLLMVLIHELGHYTAGRILKFKINEFSIGFGKAIFQKTNKRGELISLRIFPLGGYCAFAGETDEAGAESDPQAFNNQAPWKRIIVLFMGAFFNFLSAILFSFILLISFGYDVRQITEVPETLKLTESSEEVVNYNYNNLQVGDVVFKVNGVNVDFAFTDSFEGLLLDCDKNSDIVLTVRDAEGNWVERVVRYNILSAEDGTEVYKLGINLTSYRYSFGEALARCVPFAIGLAWLVLKSLWMLITFQIPITDIGGPVTTVATIATLTQTNIANLFVLIPLIAANLAAFNLLPFPALDGAHIVFTGVEWIRKKPINKKVENAIHTAGLVFLLGFVVIVDILHFVL